MDCLRSFTVSINQNSTFTAPDVKTWTLGVQEYFVFEISNLSTLIPQGFKNIDIYGVELVGMVQSQKSALTGGCIVDDWNFVIFIDGSIPLLSSIIQTSPNYWSIQVDGNGPRSFTLSKNTNSVKLLSPLKSVKEIRFEKLQAQGYGGQTVGTVSLDWDFTFMFFYKYEGE